MRSRKSQILKKNFLTAGIVPVILILTVAGIAAYANSFDASFHWDDLEQIVGNDEIHDLSTFSEPSEWFAVKKRPVSRFSLALNWSLGGQNVLGYHIVNLILHILASLMVFLITRYTISSLPEDEPYDRRMLWTVSVFVALLFLLHPLQTMAVTYIVQRMTVLAALFYLLAVYLYARGRMAYLKDGKTLRSAILILLAVFSGLLALLSKQNAVTFPAAFLLYELFFIRKRDGKLCRKYAGTYLVVLTTGFLAVLFSGFLPAETEMYSRIEYFSAQLGVFHKYLLLILFPISQNADYYINPGHPLIGLYQIIGIMLVLALLLLGVLLYKRNRLVSFGIFWFFISMSIESGLIPIKDIMMEHRIYLPMFGVCMIVAGIVLRYVPYSKIKYFYAIGSVILILLALGTYNRNKVWASEISLWEDCLEKNPQSARAMNNLGYAIKSKAMQNPYPDVRRQELIRSIAYFSRATGGDTIFTDAYLNRGLAYMELQEYDKALADIKLVESDKPRKRFLRYYLEGIIHARKGDIGHARNLFDDAISLNSDFALLYTWRGLVLTELKEDQAAIDDFQRSLEIDPTQTILYINISQLNYNLKNYAQALYWITQAKDEGHSVDHEYMDALEEAFQDK